MNRLNDYYEQHDITVSFLPTQIAESFMHLPNRSLRLLLTAGDKLRSFTPQRYEVYNNYGPTENTVVATCHLVRENEPNIPIGKPVRKRPDLYPGSAWEAAAVWLDRRVVHRRRRIGLRLLE